ncbi:MAG TPA: transposase, partial [Streptosporangiaceae bacterium]|nr:transposase [Streptosporangiaceae bacterium]
MIVSADGKGIVSQSGGLLLTRTLQVTGLDRGLSAELGRWRPGRAVHDPGKIVADLAVTLALGGDCLADIAMLRAEPGLYGPVASDPPDPTETADFYQLCAERHRKAPTVVTSNRTPDEWLSTMADPLPAQSAADRLASTT